MRTRKIPRPRYGPPLPPAVRPSPRPRNRTADYQRTRVDVLDANPLCVACLAEGRTVAAAEVDHVVPLHLGGTDDPSNLQGLCLRHHALKSAKEKREAGAKRMMRGHLPDGTPLARLTGTWRRR